VGRVGGDRTGVGLRVIVLMVEGKGGIVDGFLIDWT